MDEEEVKQQVSRAWHRIITAKSITKEEFTTFVDLLAEDVLADNPAYWKNNNISEYLTALASVIKDINRWYQNNNVEILIEPSWRSFALALHMAGGKDQKSIPRSVNTKYISQDEVSDAFDKIATKEDVIGFIALLAEDAIQFPSQWENSTHYRYLEALGRWTESIDGWYKHQNLEVPTEPNWQMFGIILWAAAIYE